MSATRQGVDARALQWMLLLCVIWGLQQVAIKLALPGVSPAAQAACASASKAGPRGAASGQRDTLAGSAVSTAAWASQALPAKATSAGPA